MSLPSRTPTPAEILGANRIPVPPNQTFEFRWVPGAWELGIVHGVSVILPILSRRDWTPGTPGIRSLHKGETGPGWYQQQKEREEKAGHVYMDPLRALPREVLPEDADPGPYLRLTDCIDPRSGVPGTCYHTPWDDFEEPVNPEEAGRIRCVSKDLKDLWRYYVVASGQVPAPSEKTKARIIADKQAALERYASLVIPDPMTKDTGIKSRTATLKRAKSAEIPSEEGWARLTKAPTPIKTHKRPSPDAEEET